MLVSIAWCAQHWCIALHPFQPTKSVVARTYRLGLRPLRTIHVKSGLTPNVSSQSISERNGLVALVTRHFNRSHVSVVRLSSLFIADPNDPALSRPIRQPVMFTFPTTHESRAELSRLQNYSVEIASRRRVRYRE